ncbi:DUF805 domain-containing protein [Allosphingosinicella flava]|uniref:DUF805 domain-containing protein n=1 Tax=Allosphingosinicella flava TaxID=2771430 RepID=A0A7T2GLQ8_9SPHN|nr:DUF805 domain-containing protein [Sphingosinicella flava]
MEWMLLPLKRYAEFSGRSRRKEYWMFTLFLFLVNIAAGLVLSLVMGGAAMSDGDGGIMAALGGSLLLLAILGLVFLIPSIAVGVRRLHDQDKSGWFLLLGLIPYLGAIVLIVMMCLSGTPGPNRYGPDPKAGEY